VSYLQNQVRESIRCAKYSPWVAIHCYKIIFPFNCQNLSNEAIEETLTKVYNICSLMNLIHVVLTSSQHLSFLLNWIHVVLTLVFVLFYLQVIKHFVWLDFNCHRSCFHRYRELEVKEQLLLLIIFKKDEVKSTRCSRNYLS